MITPIKLFAQAQAMARYASAKQGVVAENIANANTPGFKAKEISPFQAEMAASTLSTTRAGHIQSPTAGGQAAIFVNSDAVSSPNGNTVSLEVEMLKSVEAERMHGRALAVYQSGLEIMRHALGRR